ncbi:GTPase [Crenothrix sp.]|uniref:GTPase domain-containing protein n=1 Tax=Crenothrix sp. TaxID=3100433 RepID=UPI00374D67FD
MLDFIQLLKGRYQSVITQLSDESTKTIYQQRMDQLLLAEAFIRKGELIDTEPKNPLQIAVVGPTQAGKSSLVNVLLNTTATGVSPLAGYTVHPHGFCNSVKLMDCTGLQRYFGRFQQLQHWQLSKDRHDCYSLAESSGISSYLPHSVLWDTPDFDSIDSSTYREGVIRTIALADIVILVVSKEKYADQSVWELMSTLEYLHQPTLICLNKLSEGSESLLINSLQQKWQQARSDAFPDVVPLYYQKDSQPVWPQAQQALIQQLATKVNLKKHDRFETELLQKYWPSWLEPVVSEHQSLTDWQNLVDQVLVLAVDNYQRDFLNHPHHYETFQLAMAELLNLLEIPGLASLLANTRKILTWPLKKLIRLGRKKLHIADTSQEVALLNQICEHTLIQMADKILEKTEHSKQTSWWKECSVLLRAQRPALMEQFASAAQNYHINFQDDIEATAKRLYIKLQDQPMVLNSLRATRATTDAAVIALTLHTGGIGLHDLIIAPAMLAVTSLLTESAIGSYITRLEVELKKNQLATVKQSLFDDTLRKKLLALPEQLSAPDHFNISLNQLQAAETQLTEKRHGFRLL